MSCDGCREAFELDGIEPDCFCGGCVVGFDRLEDEDLRLLEIRWILVNLSELGLSDLVSREFSMGRDDLYQLAMIEADCRAMAEPQGDRDGEGR